ncbi:MAG TPA: hypothetical protein VFP96_09770, partial [Candidatus Acidoferrum sp.]|nr:hypothetical protein [Candidatus Acidoferrum sp.]
ARIVSPGIPDSVIVGAGMKIGTCDQPGTGDRQHTYATQPDCEAPIACMSPSPAILPSFNNNARSPKNTGFFAIVRHKEDRDSILAQPSF